MTRPPHTGLGMWPVGRKGDRLGRRRVVLTCFFVICFAFITLMSSSANRAPKLKTTYNPADIPRQGEEYISDEQFFQCVWEMLRRGRAAPMEKAIPLMTIPVTLEYMDMKALFCNMTVPVQRVMLINTGNFTRLRDLLDRLVDAVDAPEQLFVHHHPENLGYAASVNKGFRMALDLGPEVVPFVFVTNCDVRFFNGGLDSMIANAHRETAKDLPLIKKLRAEVAKEDAAWNATSGGRMNIWEGHYDDGTVVTSRLLPARVRKLPLAEMKNTFRSHYALYFATNNDHMSAFAISYFSLAVLGLFDENFFPAYWEDPDYIARMEAVGLQKLSLKAPGTIHFSLANLNAGGNAVDNPELEKTGYLEQGRRFRRVNPLQEVYWRQKWVINPKPEDKRPFRVYPLPFTNGTFPVDAWVRDWKRIDRIREIARGDVPAQNHLQYNMSLLREVAK